MRKTENRDDNKIRTDDGTERRRKKENQLKRRKKVK